MAEPPSTPRLYAYEMPSEPGVVPGGLSGVVRPQPVVAGERLTTGEVPDERHWDVVSIEPTERDGQRPLLSGPPGFPRQDVIWSGRLILRRVG